MSIKLDEAFVMAAVGLSPLAEAVIRDRYEDFKTDEEFAPFFPLLRAELVDFMSKLNALADENALAKTDVNNPQEARNIVNLIRIFAYKKVQAASPTQVIQRTSAPTHSQASAVSAPAVPFHIGREPHEDPNGSQACYIHELREEVLDLQRRDGAQGAGARILPSQVHTGRGRKTSSRAFRQG